MNASIVVQEWQECRNTIGRFDGYLLQLRLLGFSVFTVLFTVVSAISQITIGGKAIDISSESILIALLTLSLFVAAIYILDRYYERMLLVSVLRASELESYQLEGFRIGLTTVIEFQKEITSGRIKKVLKKASTMVNAVYVLIFITLWGEYLLLTIESNCGIFAYIMMIAMVFVVVTLAYGSHLLLADPYNNFILRSEINRSPVVFSRDQIMNAIENISSNILSWLTDEHLDIHDLHIVSVLHGARPFTNDLIKNIHNKRPDINITIHPVCITSSTSSELDNCEVEYGEINPIILLNKLVIVVDDVIDSGSTLKKVIELTNYSNPLSVKTAILIKKYADCDCDADFIGLRLGLTKTKLKTMGLKDYWLFGYGMDVNGLYRDIEHIGWVRKEL